MKSVLLLLLLLVVTVVKSNKNVDQIDFFLYNRQRGTGSLKFNMFNIPNIAAQFEKIVYIVHGWKRSAKMPKIQDLKKGILDRIDVGVIIVNWEHLASNGWYPTAASSTKNVAKHLVHMWNWTKKKNPKAYIWCVGHSLGAHACGFAGQSSKIDQVTGLDPPGIAFQSYEYGLNHKSADFVQVIHTTTTAGTFSPRGHADFYPNGGYLQPHCWFWDITCSHEYSIIYFRETFLKGRSFPASQCGIFLMHLTSCKPCTNCRMGFLADPKIRGFYYVRSYHGADKGAN